MPSLVFIVSTKTHAHQLHPTHCVHLLRLGQRTDDVRISGIGDRHRADTEVATASGSQLNVVAAVVMDAGLGEHRVVLDLGLPVERMQNELD